MVRGIEKFKEYFKGYTGNYVFIGGTACDILLGNMGEAFRKTKDMDMVLLMENLNDEFVNVFISFVEDGGYEHIDKGTGDSQFYRFSKPKDENFPYMIELFSKRPDYLGEIMSHLGSIHISDDVISLSAILLDDEYYDLLKRGAIIVDNVSLLDLEYIILFKIKAWIDLSERKTLGEEIDSRDVKKHKNDVLRLAANIDYNKNVSVSGQIKKDLDVFLEMLKSNPVNLKSLGIKNVLYEEIIEVIENCYSMEER